MTLMYEILNNPKIISSFGLFLDIVGIIFIAYSFKNIRRDKEKGGSSWSGNDKEHLFLIKFDRISKKFQILHKRINLEKNYLLVKGFHFSQ